ncbi:flagellar protein FlgN [Roseovarius sp.]|uniref:flagellar protein FlgN n=1 Tax=Roseovarius sp. TaxID=1486281 RepID=UPI0026092D0B|nr:flagellar protein FlgN [Roseovarius sp.]
MTHDTEHQIIRRLDSLLEIERAALLKGDLQAIPKLVEEKEGLIDALNAMTDSVPSKLEALQAKVTRNQALLDGALQGIRNVAARMAAFRRMRRSMETYDEYGHKHTILGEVDHKVEKRA